MRGKHVWGAYSAGAAAGEGGGAFWTCWLREPGREEGQQRYLKGSRLLQGQGIFKNRGD